MGRSVNPDWLSILSICISLGVPVAIFVARNWLVAWISKSVQHRFDVRLEELRAELRKNEERFKSDLREKEAEISTLRNSVLSGSAGRQAMLDKRRFEAVEKVWTNVNDLSRLKAFAAQMEVLNYKAIAREVRDPRMQQFLAAIGSAVPDIEQLKSVARDERPFLPELAWAYFTAYRAVLFGVHGRFMILRTGLEDPEKLLSKEGMQKILKTALPHRSEFIDEHEPEQYHVLLEEIEVYLIIELRKILAGEEADQAAAMRAQQIADAITSADKERAERAADALRTRG
jgi:hypothetical protein